MTAGDLGWLDPDGYLYLAGREAEAIRIGEDTIHPALVEAKLAAEPGVADCAVLGMPGHEGPDVVTACVEPVAGAALDCVRLSAMLDAALPAAARPGLLMVVDRLPREPSGKLSKVRLRQSLPSSC